LRAPPNSRFDPRYQGLAPLLVSNGAGAGDDVGIPDIADILFARGYRATTQPA
jgi:hypothetical protein